VAQRRETNRVPTKVCWSKWELPSERCPSHHWWKRYCRPDGISKQKFSVHVQRADHHQEVEDDSQSTFWHPAVKITFHYVMYSTRAIFRKYFILLLHRCMRQRSTATEVLCLSVTSLNVPKRMFCNRVGLPVIRNCLCTTSHKTLCRDLHEFFFTTGRSWLSLKVISFWRWSRLTFTVVWRSQSPSRWFHFLVLKIITVFLISA